MIRMLPMFNNVDAFIHIDTNSPITYLWNTNKRMKNNCSVAVVQEFGSELMQWWKATRLPRSEKEE